MKWSWRPGPAKKLHVKVKPLKLDGFCRDKMEVEKERERMIVLKMNWKGSKSGLAPFYKVSTCQRNYSAPKFLREYGGPVEWDDEFESVCYFWIGSKDKSFIPWDVSFNVLYGEDACSRTKLAVLGNVSFNIAELASRMDSQVETRLPISLQIDGATSQATLLIRVSFAEVRKSNDPLGMVQNWTESGNQEGILKIVKGETTGPHKTKEEVAQPSFCDSVESAVFDLDGSPANKYSIATSEDSNTETTSGTELGSAPSSDTQPNSPSNVGWFPWKKRRLSFGLSRKKREPLIEKTVIVKAETNLVDSDKCGSVQKDEGFIASDQWEVKELVSRDGQAKLKSSVFFASFDQRSEKAAGESACTAIVAIVADWLHSNPSFVPTLSQFDSLITEGSSHWRQLCDNEAYVNSFPDYHFDLETVFKADLRPLTILHEKSCTGIFSPEKFENLKGAMSFDDIWKEISSNTTGYDHKIYIVSWNDHFFVLKVDGEAYYIIDSLGERLFEGCKQAYILKFDESSLMSGKAAKEEVGSEEMAGAETGKSKEETEDIICKGKECCGEFIKRFLASIPVGELEEEEKRGKVSTLSLLQRLQIDFHYCSSSSSSSSASSSSSLTYSTSSFFSSEECISLE